MIYSTEKSIKELGGKVDSTTKTNVEEAIGRLRKAMEGSDTQEIKQKTEELTQASHKLAEAMYQKAAASGGDAGGGDQTGASQKRGPDDDVVDADFEEVKDK